LARIEAMAILHSASSAAIAQAAMDMVTAAGIKLQDLSLLLGLNGDAQQDKLYGRLLSIMPQSVPVAAFKPLCGEFDTASGFGLWLALQLMGGSEIPAELSPAGRPRVVGTAKNTLLINHFIQGAASLILIMPRA
jgi:hypothetical protein